MLYRLRDTLSGMPTLSERITEAIDAAKSNGHSVAHIATACSITPQAVYQWMDGATKSLTGENLAELAEISGYRALWISKEKGPKLDSRSIRQAIKLMEMMTPERQADAVKIIAPLVEQGVANRPPQPSRKFKGKQ